MGLARTGVPPSSPQGRQALCCAGVRRSPVQKLKSVGGVATPRPLVMGELLKLGI
jgi:hypothetical protein